MVEKVERKLISPRTEFLLYILGLSSFALFLASCTTAEDTTNSGEPQPVSQPTPGIVVETPEPTGPSIQETSSGLTLTVEAPEVPDLQPQLPITPRPPETITPPEPNIIQPRVEGNAFIYEIPGRPSAEAIMVWWEYENEAENIIRIRFGTGSGDANQAGSLDGTCRFQFLDANENLIETSWGENNCAIVGADNEGIQVKRDEFNLAGQLFSLVNRIVLQVRTSGGWENATKLDVTRIFRIQS